MKRTFFDETILLSSAERASNEGRLSGSVCQHLVIMEYLQHINNNHTSSHSHTQAETIYIIIPHVKIVSRDWLTKVGHSVMSTSEMSTSKTSTVLTGFTGSHCCFHWYFTKLEFVRYNKNKYAMPVWLSWWNVFPQEDGFPSGSALGKTILPLGDIPSA